MTAALAARDDDDDEPPRSSTFVLTAAAMGSEERACIVAVVSQLQHEHQPVPGRPISVWRCWLGRGGTDGCRLGRLAFSVRGPRAGRKQDKHVVTSASKSHLISSPALFLPYTYTPQHIYTISTAAALVIYVAAARHPCSPCSLQRALKVTRNGRGREKRDDNPGRRQLRVRPHDIEQSKKRQQTSALSCCCEYLVSVLALPAQPILLPPSAAAVAAASAASASCCISRGCLVLVLW